MNNATNTNVVVKVHGRTIQIDTMDAVLSDLETLKSTIRRNGAQIAVVHDADTLEVVARIDDRGTVLSLTGEVIV